MPEQTPDDLPLDAFKHWKPEDQARALELLKARQFDTWRAFFCPNPGCDGKPHDKDWDFPHARTDQRPPKWSDEWLVWLLAGGRGSGKTRTGAEVTHRVTKRVSRIILIAPTGPDLRETMVEGVSGLLATAAPDKRPKWEPSKKRLTWPNGCIAQGFSAEEPDRLRGPQGGFVWGDEPGHWPLVDEVWSNMLFGLRMGTNPKVVATSTPKPTKWMKDLIKAENTVTTRVSTYENIDNLAPTFRKAVLDRYEGTRLGRQELYGELLEDVEGALWQWSMFQWQNTAPEFTRVVVSVDPAGTANARSDETGIIVLGLDELKRVWVLADYTGRYSPEAWAKRAWNAVDEFSADAIVAEKNYGQDMVKYVLENSGYNKGRARLIGVESRRGKAIRAEPVVALYEKKRVVHLGPQGGALADLEDEQTMWVPGEGSSPNRVDALVHGCTELVKNILPASVASPNQLLNRYRAETPRHLRAV